MIRKFPIGTNKNWPKDPEAIATPIAVDLLSSLTTLPTAPRITAVPVPAIPMPTKVSAPITSNELFVEASQNNPVAVKRIPMKAVLPVPYLSDIPPNTGEKAPIIRWFKATARLKVSLPTSRKLLIGSKNNPKACLTPNEEARIIDADTNTIGKIYFRLIIILVN